MGKTNCLIAPNGKDMKLKFQNDPLGNSPCKLIVVELDCLDVSVTFYWGKTPFYVLPPQRRKTSRRTENPQRAVEIFVDEFSATMENTTNQCK